MLKSLDAAVADGPERAAVGRPRKLTRDEIVDGAIALVEKKGPQALTMRALGKLLGVQASTFYNYFASVDQLNQEISRKLLDSVPLPGSIEGIDARSDLLTHLMAMHAVLSRHPEVLDRKPGSASWVWSLHRLEAALALLSSAGVPPQKAIMVVRLLDVSCIASAQVAHEWNTDESVARRRQLFNGVKPAQLPHLAAVQGTLIAQLPDAQALREMLEALLDSLLPELRTKRKKS